MIHRSVAKLQNFIFLLPSLPDFQLPKYIEFYEDQKDQKAIELGGELQTVIFLSGRQARKRRKSALGNSEKTMPDCLVA